MANTTIPVTRNGWTIYFHPLFGNRYRGLVEAAQKRRRKDPEGYGSHPDTKLFAHISGAIYDHVPQDPAAPQYRMTSPIRGWSRVKLGRYRLFFRFDSARKIIIYCWLNYCGTLRKEGASTDPYAVFVRMLSAGDPPGHFDALLAQVE